MLSLVAVLLAANYALIWALTSIQVPDLPAKILTEAALLGVSYAVQHRFLFVRKAHVPSSIPATETEPVAVETHIPALVPAQFQHSLAGKSGDQSPKRFRSN